MPIQYSAQSLRLAYAINARNPMVQDSWCLATNAQRITRAGSVSTACVSGRVCKNYY
jgi:hypothetical protein